MKKTLKFIIIIAGILLVLAVTKPTRENFKTDIKESYESKNTDDSVGLQAIGALLNLKSQLTVKYEDRIFFATASTVVMRTNHKYVGLLGFWIPIS